MTFREYLRRIQSPTIKIGIAFFIITIITTFIYANNIFGVADALQDIWDTFFASLGDLINEDGTIKPISLILNNIQVCFLAFGLGIIPFLYVPALVLIINAVIIGVVLGIFYLESISIMLSRFLLGIVPHGILELPAIFIALACAFLLCHTITKTILRQSHDITISQALFNGLKTIIFVCVPLMIIAGLIEVYITPQLLIMTM